MKNQKESKMEFRTRMYSRHRYNEAGGWKETHVCKVQMKVWLFWVDVKVMADEDEDYLRNRAEEVIGYLTER